MELLDARVCCYPSDYGQWARLNVKSIIRSCPVGAGPAAPEAGAIVIDLEGGNEPVIFLSSKNNPVSVERVFGNKMTVFSPDVSLVTQPRSGEGIRYASPDLARLSDLERRGLIFLDEACESSDYQLFQFFWDRGMTDYDWGTLGFFPPRWPRPAISRANGRFARGRTPYVRVGSDMFPEMEARCTDPWKHFVEGEYGGGHFTRLDISATGEAGLFRGVLPGSAIVPHRDFIEGNPYLLETRTTLSGISHLEKQEHGFVFYAGQSYLSFDPRKFSCNGEIRAFWKGCDTRHNSLYAPRESYIPEKEARSKYFIHPRVNKYNVWFHGEALPCPGLCVLAPGGKITYKRRPDKGTRQRLVSLYGGDAVPLAFSKYTEADIAKKRKLLDLVKSGGWGFLVNGRDASDAFASAYKNSGSIPPVSWHVWQKIHNSFDRESDPMGTGMFVRLPSKDELFDGGGPYMEKLVEVLEREGWGFFIEELLKNPEKLRGGLLTVVIS